jgi:hypothetical protein
MDLTKAVGAGQFPGVATADTLGTVQETDTSDYDFTPALHAALMIIAFVGLMPIGLLILRIMNSVKWHALNQTLSAAVALVGVFVGIYCGTMYNRVCPFPNSVFTLLTVLRSHEILTPPIRYLACLSHLQWSPSSFLDLYTIEYTKKR